MINTLELISKQFHWAKPIILILGFGFFNLFIASIFRLGGINNDVYLIPSLLGTIWAGLFFILISTFQFIPAKPTKDTAFFSKIKSPNQAWHVPYTKCHICVPNRRSDYP
jgi:hypothetical protein